MSFSKNLVTLKSIHLTFDADIFFEASINTMLEQFSILRSFRILFILLSSFLSQKRITFIDKFLFFDISYLSKSCPSHT